MSNPFEHSSLNGRDRLISVVEELALSCPWSASISPLSMVKWLQSECEEVMEAIEDASSPNASQEAIEALTSEMGDVLFDALMLHLVVTRDFQIPYLKPWETAALKVESRTPYMSVWGDGSVANNAKEAEELWYAAKLREKPVESTFERLTNKVISFPSKCSKYLRKNKKYLLSTTSLTIISFGLGYFSHRHQWLDRIGNSLFGVDKKQVKVINT